MDGAGVFNTDGCQVIVVTTEEWVDGLPLGECNNHMVLLDLFEWLTRYLHIQCSL